MTNTRRVYSSDGDTIDFRKKPKAQKPVPGAPAGKALPDDGVVRVFRETSKRGGKTVTVIRGLPARGPALEARAQELKRLCGSGGTIKDNAIEIQGDHRDRVAERLRDLGHTVKLAGG